MSGETTHRATRLLRWYPASWRERYGEEFVDHLEQEFSDRPVDVRRTANIAIKGLVARVADVGLVQADVNAAGHSRAAVGTTFVLSAMVAFIAIDFWSRAMLAWNNWSRASVADSMATSVLTVSVGLLVMALLSIVLSVAYCVVRQMVRGGARALAGPSILAAGSGGFLLYVSRLIPQEVARYVHGAAGFPGIRLSNPGQVMNALAQITWDQTQSWIGPWHQGLPKVSVIQTVMNDGVPIAVIVFGVAIALLSRRIELPRAVDRIVARSVPLLWSLISVFFITYLIWSGVGGSANGEYFFPESAWLGVTYLVFMPLAAAAVARAGYLARRMSQLTSTTLDGNESSGALPDRRLA